MTLARPLLFNGKFYSGALNGVHRVADRLIREIDAILANLDPAERPEARLLVPTRRTWQPSLRMIQLIEEPKGDSQRWEQLILPRRARDHILVNLANLAPVVHPRQLLLIHDAQFYFSDSSYPLRQQLGYRLLVPLMARRSAAVLTVSSYSRQMLDLLGVSPATRTSVLYNGGDHILEHPSDPEALTRLGVQPGSYVLMFGSIKAYKNNRVVLDAFAVGALAPLRLVIIGPQRDALKNAGLTLSDDILFTGMLHDAELRALYEGAHALVFPSRTEGFGLPPLEAMMCGCPVVAAPAGALPEICRDAVAYADVDDSVSWREAIGQLADPAVRAAKIGAGRERAARFTWAKAGRTLFEAMERIDG